MNKRLLYLLVGSVFVFSLGACKKETKTSEFDAFFPSKEYHQTFDSLKRMLESKEAALSRADNPGKDLLEDFFASWDSLYAFNNTVLDFHFTEDTSPQAIRAAYFDFVDYAVKSAHADLKAKEKAFGFSWDTITDVYKERISNVQDMHQFIFMMDEMISFLDDAHTWIGYRRNPYLKSLGVGFSREGEAFRVDGVYYKLVPEGLDIGDKVVRVDGVPVDSLYEAVKQRTIFHDYPGMDHIVERRVLRTYYYHYLREKAPDSCRITFEKKNGESLTHAWKWYPVRAVRNMYGVRIHPKKKVGIEGRLMDDGRFGYVKIDKWNAANIPVFDSLFDSMRNTGGFVLDIRNNFGGDFTNFGQHVLSKFLYQDTVTLFKKFRNSPLYHLYGFGGLHYQDDVNYQADYFPLVPVKCKASKEDVYKKPVVLLVNGKHFSSNDLFMVAFRELNVGKIAGRTNPFQMLGQPIYIKKTPWNDWGLGLSVMVPYSPRKKDYDGKRLKIDFPVPLTMEEISGHHDPILDKALGYLRAQNE